MLACLSGIGYGADWKVIADKKASPVTLQRSVRIEKRAKNDPRAWVVLFCQDGKRLFRIARNYSLANSLDSAFNKSQLERTMHKGEQYERYGFAWHAKGDKRMVNVRWRFGSEQKATEREFPAGYNGGTHFALLDGSLASMLAQLRKERALFVEVPERAGAKPMQFDLVGLDRALSKAKSFGCAME